MQLNNDKFIQNERENNKMSNSLDTDAISKLAEILDKRNLTELEYEDEGCRICLTRELPQQIPSAQLQSLPITATYAQAPAAPQVVAPKEAAPAASLSEEDYAKLPGAVNHQWSVSFISPVIPTLRTMSKSETVSMSAILFA